MKDITRLNSATSIYKISLIFFLTVNVREEKKLTKIVNWLTEKQI